MLRPLSSTSEAATVLEANSFGSNGCAADVADEPKTQVWCEARHFGLHRRRHGPIRHPERCSRGEHRRICNGQRGFKRSSSRTASFMLGMSDISRAMRPAAARISGSANARPIAAHAERRSRASCQCVAVERGGKRCEGRLSAQGRPVVRVESGLLTDGVKRCGGQGYHPGLGLDCWWKRLGRLECPPPRPPPLRRTPSIPERSGPASKFGWWSAVRAMRTEH